MLIDHERVTFSQKVKYLINQVNLKKWKAKKRTNKHLNKL